MFVLVFVMASLAQAFAAPNLSELNLPAGYSIQIYAAADGARSLALGPNGIVFVGSRSGRSVYALKPDLDKDGKSDAVVKIGKSLKSPNGVAFKDGDLYVGEINRVLRFSDIEKNLANPGEPSQFGPSFPNESHHGWKYIAFGPDGYLYIPVGAPCNICDRDLTTFAAIHRITPDGSKRELVARGVRNTVGFDWHPATKELWFTDNGRDMMGDDVPPCELNRLTKLGENFGYPYCHGSDVLDPKFGKGKSCASFTAPVHGFPAHVAPLGMRFVSGGGFSSSATAAKSKTATATKSNTATVLVAEHGSWNRSSPIGYQVTRIDIVDNKAVKAEPFLSGFLKDGDVSGRPVDVLQLADGSILVSDDMNGLVYRIKK